MFKYTKSALHYSWRKIKKIYSIICWIISFLIIAYDVYAIFRDLNEVLFLVCNIITLSLFVTVFVIKRFAHPNKDDTRLEKYHKKRKIKVIKIILKSLMYITNLLTIVLALVEIVQLNVEGLSLIITLASIFILIFKILLDATFAMVSGYIDILKVAIDKDMTPVTIFDKVKSSDKKVEKYLENDSYNSELEKRMKILDDEIALMDSEKENKKISNQKIIAKNKQLIKDLKTKRKEEKINQKRDRQNVKHS